MTGAEPLVVLHDHLDGGVRAATVLELLAAAGVAAPVDGPQDLARWMTIDPSMAFAEAFSRFDVVVAGMQTADALRRVSREAAEDLAADGVIHAELRFAPLLHTVGGLSPDAVVEAVIAGLDEVATPELTTAVIVCALRNLPAGTSVEAAALAARHAGPVVGFDLADGGGGPTIADHGEAFEIAGAAGLGRTVHAGEIEGVDQVAAALDACEPDRIGHGWRIIEDCTVAADRIVAVGSIASRVRDGGIPLEICLTSNACLGTPVTEHPVRLLADAGFRVTLHPDDRSITATSPRREHRLAAEIHGFTPVELAAANERSAAAAFLPEPDRRSLVERVRAGWDVRPRRLVHLAERQRWDSTRGGRAYLPADWDRDGFIHLSARHQLLTPANCYFRGRTDLVALDLDADLLGDAVVWEPGTDTVEHFPHLYSALPPEAVVAEYEMTPSADGSFLLPLGL